MSAVSLMQDIVGLNKSLLLCGVSKKAWYYTASPRDIPPDAQLQDAILDISSSRPTYGTRRMAAQASRVLEGTIWCLLTISDPELNIRA